MNWISIKDRLPNSKESQEALLVAQFKGGDLNMGSNVQIAYWCVDAWINDKNEEIENIIDNLIVTHWCSIELPTK